MGVSAMTDKEAKQIAHGLIQGYFGPDHRVLSMQELLPRPVAVVAEGASAGLARPNRSREAGEALMVGALHSVRPWRIDVLGKPLGRRGWSHYAAVRRLRSKLANKCFRKFWGWLIPLAANTNRRRRM
jgi:hypothetical protein